MHRDDDPLKDGLKKLGVHVERREATVLQQMLGSGLGGIIGQGIGLAVGASWLGRGLISLAGSIAGHMVVTHRVVYEPKTGGDPAPESPMGWSDRR